MAKESATNKSFSEKLMANKKILFIGMFLVLLLVFLVLLYVLRFNSYKDIYFSATKTDTTEVITDFSNLNDLPIELNYTYSKIEYNKKFGETEGDWFSKYYFKFNYAKKENETVTSVTVQILLHSNWRDYRYLSGTSGKSVTASATSTTEFIVETKSNIDSFAFFPVYTWDPAVYLKVVVNGSSGKTFYLMDSSIIPNSERDNSVVVNHV